MAERQRERDVIGADVQSSELAGASFMGRRSLFAVLLIPLGCLSLGLILFLATDRSSLTLADLAPRDAQSPIPRLNFLPSAQLWGEISTADWILIVYLFVGSIVALLALRAILSAVV